VAFTVSYVIGYLVNFMLIWRVFAARELAERLDSVLLPVVLVVLSSLAMWFLLTVFALALAQQPKVRRALMREIADYTSNAEARAYADEPRGRPPRPPSRPRPATGRSGRADPGAPHGGHQPPTREDDLAPPGPTSHPAGPVRGHQPGCEVPASAPPVGDRSTPTPRCGPPASRPLSTRPRPRLRRAGPRRSRARGAARR
jgi:hypothetical protein